VGTQGTVKAEHRGRFYVLIFSTTEVRAKPRNAELLSPQPSSHDKSMVSPEEHREPSPVFLIIFGFDGREEYLEH
jgi:hypothetical protein